MSRAAPGHSILVSETAEPTSHPHPGTLRKTFRAAQANFSLVRASKLRQSGSVSSNSRSVSSKEGSLVNLKNVVSNLAVAAVATFASASGLLLGDSPASTQWIVTSAKVQGAGGEQFVT